MGKPHLKPSEHEACGLRRGRIVRVERSEHGDTVWLVVEYGEPSHEHLRITLYDAPSYIESCADTEIETSAEFIFCHGKRWAKRLNYTQARLCAP